MADLRISRLLLLCGLTLAGGSALTACSDGPGTDESEDFAGGDGDDDERADDEEDLAGERDASKGGKDAGGKPSDAGKTTQDAGKTPQDAGTTSKDGGLAPVLDASPTVFVDAATADASLGTDAGTEEREDLGEGDGKDVVTIGDSWMNLNNSVGVQQSLEKVSKRDYRNYGVPGTKLLDEVIPKQYTTAKAEGPVKTVIMTGGGNDVLQDLQLGPANILQPGCRDGIFNDACKKRIDDVAARLQKLWAQMAADGVEDVVIISYSNKTLGGQYKMVSTYSAEKIDPICRSVPAPLRCTSFDTDMTVMFKDRGDAIHPDNPTYDAIGAGVWKLMQEKGVRR